MTNLFPGLARGPIDHEASSVINAIASESIDMGAVVVQLAPAAIELLPRVENADAITEIGYGIVVGGDVLEHHTAPDLSSCTLAGTRNPNHQSPPTPPVRSRDVFELRRPVLYSLIAGGE